LEDKENMILVKRNIVRFGYEKSAKDRRFKVFKFLVSYFDKDYPGDEYRKSFEFPPDTLYNVAIEQIPGIIRQ
jgi:hypothetical protein